MNELFKLIVLEAKYQNSLVKDQKYPPQISLTRGEYWSMQYNRWKV